MNRCLLCHEPLVPALHFRTLWSPDEPSGFCDSCRRGLAKIDRKNCCPVCGRDLSIVDPAFISRGVCLDCKRWEESRMSGVLQCNYSVYQYNDQMKKIMTAFKFRGDAVLVQGFKQDLQAAYKQICRIQHSQSRMARRSTLHDVISRLRDVAAFGLRRYKKNEDLIIVPVPLSEERLLERCYNQSLLLAQLLGDTAAEALIRKVNEPKQSKKRRHERLELKENPFQIAEPFRKQLAGRHVLLIDDIYTTGATLRLAAQALQPAGPKSIASLTLAHG